MYVFREVLQCKPGKVGDLRKRFQALNGVLTRLGYQPFELMTDAAGEQFWTLVLESRARSLDEFFAMEEKVMGEEEARTIMTGYHDLVANGRREVFRIV